MKQLTVLVIVALLAFVAVSPAVCAKAESDNLPLIDIRKSPYIDKILNLLIYSLIETDARQSLPIVGRGNEKIIIDMGKGYPDFGVGEANSLVAYMPASDYADYIRAYKHLTTGAGMYIDNRDWVLAIKIVTVIAQTWAVVSNDKKIQSFMPYTDAFSRCIYFEYRITF